MVGRAEIIDDLVGLQLDAPGPSAAAVYDRPIALRLLHQELEELPDHPFTLFNLGSILHELGRFREAIPVLCPPKR